MESSGVYLKSRLGPGPLRGAPRAVQAQASLGSSGLRWGLGLSWCQRPPEFWGAVGSGSAGCPPLGIRLMFFSCLEGGDGSGVQDDGGRLPFITPCRGHTPSPPSRSGGCHRHLAGSWLRTRPSPHCALQKGVAARGSPGRRGAPRSQGRVPVSATGNSTETSCLHPPRI